MGGLCNNDTSFGLQCKSFWTVWSLLAMPEERNAWLERRWIKRSLALGGSLIAVVTAFETLSDIPETIAKDKTFFSIVSSLLLHALAIFFTIVLPTCGIIVFLGVIHLALFFCFDILTSQHTKRRWLTKVEIWITPIPACIVLVTFGYLAVVSRGHPFDEMQDRIAQWDLDQRIDKRLKEIDKEQEQKISDCRARSTTDKEKEDCKFTF